MQKQSCNSTIVRHFIFSFIFLIGGTFIFAPSFTEAQKDPILETPETLEEVQRATIEQGNKISEGLLGVIPNIWRNEVIPTWKGMWVWWKKEIWKDRLRPAYDTAADQIEGILNREVTKRKPIIEEQLQEEKEKLAQELEDRGKEAGKGIWERFLDLFRNK
jgi:hypothetical protein